MCKLCDDGPPQNHTDDHGNDGFNPTRVRHADHCHLGDLRQSIDRFLDFAAGNVLAAGLDHVLMTLVAPT